MSGRGVKLSTASFLALYIAPTSCSYRERSSQISTAIYRHQGAKHDTLGIVAFQATFQVDSQHLVVGMDDQRRRDHVRGNEVLDAFGHILDNVDSLIRRCPESDRWGNEHLIIDRIHSGKEQIRLSFCQILFRRLQDQICLSAGWTSSDVCSDYDEGDRRQD